MDVQEIENLILKGLYAVSLALGPSNNTSIRKELRTQVKEIHLLLVPGHLPKREETAETLLGMETLLGFILKITFCLASAEAGGCHLGILILTC